MHDRGFFWVTVALVIGCLLLLADGTYLIFAHPGGDYMLLGAAFVGLAVFNLCRMAPVIWDEWFRNGK